MCEKVKNQLVLNVSGADGYIFSDVIIFYFGQWIRKGHGGWVVWPR